MRLAKHLSSTRAQTACGQWRSLMHPRHVPYSSLPSPEVTLTYDYLSGTELRHHQAVQTKLQERGVAKLMSDCTTNSGAQNLVGLSEAALRELLAPLGAARAESAARAVLVELYGRGAQMLRHMRGVPRAAREHLAGLGLEVQLPRVVADQRAADGTRKFLLALADGARVESVFIPEAQRGTLCVSSQVGCSLACRFCYTGTQPVRRNLRSHEILGQLLTVRAALADATAHAGRRVVTHIVFMGQGEPLYNWRQVSAALDLMRHPAGLALGRGRITVSTSGVVPNIRRLAAQPAAVQLAVSLHAAFDTLRSQLVPLNQQYPIAELLAATAEYHAAQRQQVAYEYVLLRGVNDSEADARELARLVRPTGFVNVIPFNPWPGAPFEPAPEAVTARFVQLVREAGTRTTVRWPRGRDILAACGQLNTHAAAAPAVGCA